MPGTPPRVTPTAVENEAAIASSGFITISPLESWRLMWGVFGYWMPAGINQAAQALKYSKRARVS